MIPKGLRKCRVCGAKTGTATTFGPCPNPDCPECPKPTFTLTNDPPPHRPWRGEEPEKLKQKVLIEGLKCLPGQQDLFPEKEGGE